MTLKNKIYLSGGITGIKNFEELFQKAEDQLISVGYEVVNPTKIIPPALSCGCLFDKELNPDARLEINHSWQCNMRYDIAAMMQDCNKIALMPGWEASRGACIEYTLAFDLGFAVGTVQTWIERS